MALAGELQEADLYHHCEAEKFIIIDNDDNTVDWKLEDELTSYSGEIVITIIPDYGTILLKFNDGKSTKSLDKEFKNLCNELLTRGLLTEEQVKKLQS